MCDRGRKGVMKDGRVHMGGRRLMEGALSLNHPQGVERKGASLRDFFYEIKQWRWLVPYIHSTSLPHTISSF